MRSPRPGRRRTRTCGRTAGAGLAARAARALQPLEHLPPPLVVDVLQGDDVEAGAGASAIASARSRHVRLVPGHSRSKWRTSGRSGVTNGRCSWPRAASWRRCRRRALLRRPGRDQTADQDQGERRALAIRRVLAAALLAMAGVIDLDGQGWPAAQSPRPLRCCQLERA